MWESAEIRMVSERTPVLTAILDVLQLFDWRSPLWRRPGAEMTPA